MLRWVLLALCLFVVLQPSGAQAQEGGFDPTTGDVVVPRVMADPFLPSIDAQRTIVVEDATRPIDRGLYVRGGAYWVNRPLVWAWSDGTVDTVVANAVATDIAVGYGLGPARVGVILPLYLWSNGTLQQRSGAALGDARVDAKVVLLERDGLQPGVGFHGRLGVPMGGSRKQLGNDGFSAELGAVADMEISGLLLAANLGTRWQPPADMGEFTLNNQLLYKIGASYPITPTHLVSAEIFGQGAYGAMSGDHAASPTEALLGYTWVKETGLRFHGFAGTALIDGVGAPRLRLGTMVSYVNDSNVDSDKDGIPDRLDSCPEAPEDFDGFEDEDGCPDTDNDVDGFPDATDACPDDAEDFDDFNDEDGCPEGNATVRVELIDPDGDPVKLPSLELVPRVGDPIAAAAAPVTYELSEGSWLLEAEAEGMLPMSRAFEVPAEGEITIREIMESEAQVGTLVVKIQDAAGNPLTGTWRLQGSDVEYGATGGRGRRDVPAGQHLVTVRAPNHQSQELQVLVPANDEIELVAMLGPSQVRITRTQIEIEGKVFFKLDEAEILPESFPLLNEVAEKMTDHPEILRVRVEGHTDDQGTNRYNQELSERRAASVVSHLAGRGVNVDRLDPVGFGETSPIASNDTEAGRAVNRRVRFYIVERED